MFKLLGRIFGTEKALGSLVDGVKGGLDALVYTEQEKEQDAAKERAEARSMIVGWMEQTKGQNLSRRFLAFIIGFTWLSQYWFIMVMSVSAAWIDAQSTVIRINQSVEIISESADGMTGAMMLILGFYFAAPHIGNIIKPAMERFGQRRGNES